MNQGRNYTQLALRKHVVLTGQPVTTSSPLTPQSLYAETIIAAERFLIAQSDASFTLLIYHTAMPNFSPNSLPTHQGKPKIRSNDGVSI